jgi:hypothetical protein
MAETCACREMQDISRKEGTKSQLTREEETHGVIEVVDP